MHAYRRAAVVIATVVTAAAALTVGTAPPSSAADGCTSEQGTLGSIGACDDSTPPTTTDVIDMNMKLEPVTDSAWPSFATCRIAAMA